MQKEKHEFTVQMNSELRTFWISIKTYSVNDHFELKTIKLVVYDGVIECIYVCVCVYVRHLQNMYTRHRLPHTNFGDNNLID